MHIRVTFIVLYSWSASCNSSRMSDQKSRCLPLLLLPNINFSVALHTENSRSCRLDLGHFLAYLMTLMALKAAADVNQAAENVNLGDKEKGRVCEKVHKGHRQHQTFNKEWGLT